MKVLGLSNFKNLLLKDSPYICLIIGNEPREAIEMLFSSWKEIPLTMKGSHFMISRFKEEVETLPFLSKKVSIHIQEADQLNSEDVKEIVSYIQKPNPWVFLLLSSETLPSKPLLRAVEEGGCLLTLQEEKPWEKEKHTLVWLSQEAAKEGIHLSQEGARALIKEIGMDRELLKREIEKLICYLGKKGQASLEDVRAVACHMPQETLWQLSEAIFKMNRPAALAIAKRLLESGEVIFVIFSQLRSQFRQAVEILKSFQSGGASAVAKVFPYLKGGLLQKKIDEAHHYGLTRLEQALLHVFEMEVRAKNSNDDAGFLLELLIIKLTSPTLL